MTRQAAPAPASAALWAHLGPAVRSARPVDLYVLVQALSRLARLQTAEMADVPAAFGVQFCHAASLAFAAYEVHDVRPGAADTAAPFCVTTRFFGLTGSTSPLPQVLADALADPEAPAAAQDFLSRLHHRLLQLLVARHRQTHPALAQRSGHDDGWSRRLLAWTAQHPDLPAALRWRYLRPLMQHRPSAAQLRGILRDALGQRGVAVRLCVRPMTGGFVPLDPEQSCQLGCRRHTLGRQASLGCAGWAPHSAYALDIYPQTAGDLRRLQKDSAVRCELEALCGALGPWQTRCEMFVCFGPRLATAARLGDSATLARTAFLGLPAAQVRLAWHALHHPPAAAAAA